MDAATVFTSARGSITVRGARGVAGIRMRGVLTMSLAMLVIRITADRISRMIGSIATHVVPDIINVWDVIVPAPATRARRVRIRSAGRSARLIMGVASAMTVASVNNAVLVWMFVSRVGIVRSAVIMEI